MVTRTGKKKSGGRYIKSRKKKLCERAGPQKVTKLGDTKRKSKKVRGGNKKNYLLKEKFVNVGEKEKKKLEIKNVLETPSNRFLARQNIITKGTIVETELGKVKITNRPTQESVLNGILLKE
jgi:small subunit ribosomal protein S8e